MEKQRVIYAEVFGVKYEKNSVADLIELYIRAMKQPGARGISYHQVVSYGTIQRAPIGKVISTELTLGHYEEHAQLRRTNQIQTRLHRNSTCPLKELSPATVGKDFSDLSVVLTWAYDRLDLKVDLPLLAKAKRRLKSDGLIAKSQARDRRPTSDELERRRRYFEQQNEHDRCATDMVLMDEWQNASSRRVGESCALLWRDWEPSEHTILVRKMKDPRKKNKAKVVALTPEAEAILYRLAYVMDERPELRTAEPRIFPFDKRTVSSRSTLANKALGIVGLRLHDSRRDCASRLMEKGYTSKQVSLVTGHDNTTVLDKVYGKPDPKVFAKQLAEGRP